MLYNKNMRSFLIIFSIIALVVSATAGVAYAHSDAPLASQNTQAEQILSGDASADLHNHKNAADKKSSDCGDMMCGCTGCAAHHHNHHHGDTALNDGFSFLHLQKEKQAFDLYAVDLSNPVYGLKRPPKA